MKKGLLSVFCLLSFSLNIFAQHTEECASAHIHERLMKNNLEYAAQMKSNERLMKAYSKQNANNKSSTVFTIPVVVHVIHSGQAVGVGANISMSQINSAIDTMNARYANEHGSSVDTDIEFVLAKRDPDGNSTSGVVRIDGSSVSDYATEGISAGDTLGADEDSIKSLSRWPNTQYYNIWVVTEIEDNNGLFGIQGYAYFPGASASIDGTVIMHTAFGTTGTVNSFNNRDRTLVHELGHGLNLFHTFQGDASGTICPSGDGDFVSDTDPHIRAGSNCPTGTNSCTGNSIDGVTSNFMNYSSQTCAVNFTSGQSTRMRTAINASRPHLPTSLGGTAPTGYLTAANCTPVTSSPNNGFGIGIRKVDFGGVVVVSSPSNPEGGYVDHTRHQLMKASTGDSVSISIETGNANDEDVRVYIDYNNDGDFTDTGEEVFSSDRLKTHSGKVAIPNSGISLDTVRLRVISDWYNNNITGSCYNPTFGQTEDYSILLESSTPLTTSIAVNSNVSCNGSTDGSLTATANGGTSPYTYQWSNGATTSGISSLAAGVYTITVSDVSGSTATASSTVTEPTAITTSITVVDESCGNDGSATANTLGGTNPYSYLWSGSVSTSNSINGLSSGNYSVTIVDASSCSIVESFTVGTSVCPGNSTNIQLRAQDCGKTNWDFLKINLVTEIDPNATAYRLKINGGGLTDFIVTNNIPNNNFNLSNVGLTFGTTYTVEVAVEISGKFTDYGPSCSVTTISQANAASLKLRAADCGKTNWDFTKIHLVTETDPNATAYRLRINGGSLTNFIVTNNNPNNNFNLSNIGLAFGTTYAVEVAAEIGGSFTNYGTSCNVTTMSQSNVASIQLRAADCGKTNWNYLNINLVTEFNPNATGYRLRINGGGLSNVVVTNNSANNNFNLSNVGLTFGTTYSIEAAIEIGGSFIAYGTACNVTTLAQSNAASLQLRSADCGMTGWDFFKTALVTETDPNATSYKIRINGGVWTDLEVTRPNNNFSLDHPAFNFGFSTTYSIEVAVEIGGSFTNYGTACNVTTSTLNDMVNIKLRSLDCGRTNWDYNALGIASEYQPGATRYRMRINGGALTDHEVTSNSTFFNLSNVAALAPSTVYNIEMAAEIGGNFSNYGTVCTITSTSTPSPTPRIRYRVEEEFNELEDLFEVYPNPSDGSAIYISYTLSESIDKTVDLELFDLRGQRIMKKILFVKEGTVKSDLNDLQLSKGIYLLKLTDNSSVKTQKLIIK